MNATRKSNSVITHEASSDGIITFHVVGAGSFKFDPAACTDEVERMAALHGYVQKISDKAAIGRDAKTGKSATPAEKFAAMKAMAEHLQGGGAWSTRQARPGLNRQALWTALSNVFTEECAKRGLDAGKHTAQSFEIAAGNLTDDQLRAKYLVHKEVAGAYAMLTASGEGEDLFEGLEGA